MFTTCDFNAKACLPCQWIECPDLKLRKQQTHTVSVIYYPCASRYTRYFLVEVNEWTLTLVSIEWSSVGVNSSCFSFPKFIENRNKDVMFNFFQKKDIRDYCNKDILYFHFIPKAYYSQPALHICRFCIHGLCAHGFNQLQIKYILGKKSWKVPRSKLEFSTCGELHRIHKNEVMCRRILLSPMCRHNHHAISSGHWFQNHPSPNQNPWMLMFLLV